MSAPVLPVQLGDEGFAHQPGDVEAVGVLKSADRGVRAPVPDAVTATGREPEVVEARLDPGEALVGGVARGIEMPDAEGMSAAVEMQHGGGSRDGDVVLERAVGAGLGREIGYARERQAVGDVR